MFELHLFVAIIIDSFFVIQIIKFILPIAVHSLPARKCTLPVSRLLDTNVSTESRCNAEASSSIPSSLITRRRVIILEKEVTAVATQFPTQNEKPEREHVEGMMHAEATFSGRRLQCTLVGLDSRVSRTHTLYPELSLALIVIHWKPETIESVLRHNHASVFSEFSIVFIFDRRSSKVRWIRSKKYRAVFQWYTEGELLSAS